MKQVRHILLLAALGALLSRADIVTCHCDAARPETLEARECALCREAEKQPANESIFFLHDVNPTKPNRWLALPREHERSFDQLTRGQQVELLRAAMEKARELFGNDWGIAYNAPEVQTQCHVHLHLGKWMQQTENDQFVLVKGMGDVPAPRKGEGFWIHAVSTGLHVHTDGPITETVLLR